MAKKRQEQAPHRPSLESTGNPNLDALVARFVDELGIYAGPDGLANPDLVEQAFRVLASQFTLGARNRPVGLGVDAFTGDVINFADEQREAEKLEVRIIEDSVKLLAHLAKFPGSKAWICGSARTAVDTSEYRQIVEIARMLADEGLWVTNGGGPGAMQAATEGAGTRAVQVGIELPFEDPSDDASTVTLAKFFLRKLGMLRHAKVVVVAPGGLGTDEEVKEVLTLIQTGKQPVIPVFLFDEPGSNFWSHVDAAFDVMVSNGKMSPHDRLLYKYVHDVESIRQEIRSFYAVYHSHVQIADETGNASASSRSWINMRLQLNASIKPEDLVTLTGEFGDIIPDGQVRRSGLTPKELRRIERCLATSAVARSEYKVFTEIAAERWRSVGTVSERRTRIEELLFDTDRTLPDLDPDFQAALRAEYQQPRIGFWFNDRGYARLGQLIARVNDLGRVPTREANPNDGVLGY